MKKLFLMVLLLPLFAFSCDDKEEEFTLDLSGSWVTLSLSDSVYSNSNPKSTAIQNEIYNRFFADTYTFHPGGKVDFKSLIKGEKQGTYYFADSKLHIKFPNELVVSYSVGLSYTMVLITSRTIDGGFGNLAPLLPPAMVNDPELQISKIDLHHYLFKIGASTEHLQNKPNIPGMPDWDKIPDVVQVYKDNGWQWPR